MIANAITPFELILWIGGLGVFAYVLPGAAGAWWRRRKERQRWENGT